MQLHRLIKQISIYSKENVPSGQGDHGGDIFFFLWDRAVHSPNLLKFIDKDLTNNIDMGIIDFIVI